MSTEGPPVVFDTVVLSNFAASESIDWLCSRFHAPRTVEAVERELRRGQAEGYTFVERAIDALGAEITVAETDETTVERFSERVDTGEAEALAAAVELDGIVATDDRTARELARESDIPFTGSVGILADGVRRDELDVETADRWLSKWCRSLATIPNRNGRRTPLRLQLGTDFEHGCGGGSASGCTANEPQFPRA